MDGAAGNSSGEKTFNIPVVRDPRYQRYSPLGVGVSRMPSELVEKFELRLQSPVQRDNSHRFGAMANGEIGIVERAVSLEIIDHAAIELTAPQLLKLRDDISRLLGAAPASAEVARDRLSELAALIVAAETALSQAAARSRESAVATPEKAELALLNAKVELLAAAMARVEALAADWGRSAPAGGGGVVVGASSRATLFDSSPQERRPTSPAAMAPAPPAARGGHWGLLLLLVICGAGALAWMRDPPLRAAITGWFSANFQGFAPVSASSTAQDGADQPPPAAPVAPAPATGGASAPDAPKPDAPTMGGAEPAPASAPAPQPATISPSGHDANTQVPDSPAVGSPAEPKSPPPAAPKEAAVAAPLVHQTILARADAWIRVRDMRGTTYIERTLKAGETWPVPAVPGLTLTTGNAGGTFLVVDGVAGPPLGALGATRSGIQLSPAAP
jgi:hypothetical protein